MKKGDKIEILDEALAGTIKEVFSDTLIIETADGFEIELSKKEVVMVKEGISKKEIEATINSSRILEKEQHKKPAPKPKKVLERKMPPIVVDLHIEKLIKSYKRLTNHEILTIQLENATRQLDFAIKKRIQRIVFIHGVGEGVLRTELEFLFKRYDSIKYYDADYQKYGQGATEVYIYQNKI